VVRGSLDRVRDFVYIDDVVDAWLKAIAHTEKRVHQHKILNIGTGVGTSVGQIVRFLEPIAGPFELEVQGSTPADQNTVVSDPSSAFATLGWQSTVTFETGLQRMWQWAKASWQNHPETSNSSM